MSKPDLDPISYTKEYTYNSIAPKSLRPKCIIPYNPEPVRREVFQRTDPHYRRQLACVEGNTVGGTHHVETIGDYGLGPRRIGSVTSRTSNGNFVQEPIRTSDGRQAYFNVSPKRAELVIQGNDSHMTQVINVTGQDLGRQELSNLGIKVNGPYSITHFSHTQ